MLTLLTLIPFWSHFSLLDGDDKTTWFDASLTPLGIAQATALSSLWLASHQRRRPARPADVAALPRAPSWTPHGWAYRPTVKEQLRERWTMAHVRPAAPARVDRRALAGVRVIEDGFVEEDVSGQQPRDETEAENQTRILEALADVFEHDGSHVVAWMFHSLAMQALLGALGMVPFKVQPATTVALLVRGEKEV